MTHRTLPLRLLAAAPLLLLCHALVRHTPMPPAMAAAFAAFAVASAVWPAVCLTLLAALVPLATTFGSQLSRSFRWSEAVVVTFLTGAILRLLVRGPASSRPARALDRAVLAFAVIVAASWVVELVMLQYTTDFPAHFIRVVWELFTRDFFRDPGAFVRPNDALLLLEGTALGLCVYRFSDPGGTVPRSVLRMTVVAAAACAVLNAQRMAQIVLQHGGGWGTLLALAPTTRLSVVHTDVNAAGSYFALALPIALALGTEHRKQLGWLAAALAVVVAIWLTGSRAAIAAAGATVVIFLGMAIAIVRTPGQRRVMMLALIGSIGIMIVATVQYPQNRNTSPGTALDLRADMARAALDLFETRPIFGIGVGSFWQRSGDYIPARSRSVFPHENAHNNFLQILAELGVAGLAAFLWINVAATRPLRSIAGSDGLLVAGTLCGVLAFLLTCLTGHPLLTREVAYPFWLVLGATAALRAADIQSARPASTRVARVASAVFVAAVALTVPFRVQHEKLTRKFEDVSVGYSSWNTADDGLRFRWAQRRSRFFVPANTPYVLIPLRLGPREQESSVVTVRLDGNVVNTVTVLRDRWTIARVVLASGRFTPRSRLIELDGDGPEDQNPALMVGRPGQ